MFLKFNFGSPRKHPITNFKYIMTKQSEKKQKNPPKKESPKPSDVEISEEVSNELELFDEKIKEHEEKFAPTRFGTKPRDRGPKTINEYLVYLKRVKESIDLDPRAPIHKLPQVMSKVHAYALTALVEGGIVKKTEDGYFWISPVSPNTQMAAKLLDLTYWKQRKATVLSTKRKKEEKKKKAEEEKKKELELRETIALSKAKEVLKKSGGGDNVRKLNKEETPRVLEKFKPTTEDNAIKFTVTLPSKPISLNILGLKVKVDFELDKEN